MSETNEKPDSPQAGENSAPDTTKEQPSQSEANKGKKGSTGKTSKSSKSENSESSQLKITAIRDGFCRAGRRWSTMPTVVDTAEFTEEQVDALRTEPMLKVEDVLQVEA